MNLEVWVRKPPLYPTELRAQLSYLPATCERHTVNFMLGIFIEYANGFLGKYAKYAKPRIC